jgi:hypothetical protein
MYLKMHLNLKFLRLLKMLTRLMNQKLPNYPLNPKFRLLPMTLPNQTYLKMLMHLKYHLYQLIR